MIDVLVGIERGQRQPGENRWKASVAQPFPQQPAPLNVVVAIEVATANGIGGELKSPEYQRDYHRSRGYLDGARCSIRFQRIGKLGRDLHLLTFFDRRNQSQRCSIRSRRARSSIGLVRWALKPASKERLRSSNIENPVTATIGTLS